MWQFCAVLACKENKPDIKFDSLENDDPRKRRDSDSEGSGSVGTKRVVLRDKERSSTESDADNYYPPRTKKPRVIWPDDLHDAFVHAVNQLEPENKVVPKRILQLMGMPNLTRENVASHLQKYRDQKKKMEAEAKIAQQNEMALPSTSSSGASVSSRAIDQY